MTFCFQKKYTPEVEQLLRRYYQTLSEKNCRRFAAVEAITLGHGGIGYIANVLGCDPQTVRDGIRELKQLCNDIDSNVFQTTDTLQDDYILKGSPESQELEHLKAISINQHLSPQTLRRSTRCPFRKSCASAEPSGGRGAACCAPTVAGSVFMKRTSRIRDQYRIRRPGGGRKLTEEKYPTIVGVLEQMLNSDNEIAGDPMSEQKWVRSTPQRLSERLKEKGYQVSSATVRRLLKKMGFSLKANQRKQVRSKNPERDKQFQYIAYQRQRFTAVGLPIVSVDSKKKELIGDYKNNGRTWRREAEEVYDHDFPDMAECKAVPFGIYDVTKNTGYVVVGTSNNTPEFSVNAIARWWEDDGRTAYPSVDELLILADGGGSNGARVRAWKYNLQEKFCNRFGITVTVCHYPTGCSKWNPVEHRLFSQISLNWAGQPLRTLGIMLGYIRGTTTATGLQVKACLDDNDYKKGQRVKRKDFEQLSLRTHSVCPKWNYTISPRQ